MAFRPLEFELKLRDAWKGASFSLATRWHSRCSRSMFFRVASCFVLANAVVREASRRAAALSARRAQTVKRVFALN